MFEVYYLAPQDAPREARIGAVVTACGGHLDYREEGPGASICLTYEFDALPDAERAIAQVRALGEYAEGTGSYG